MSFARFQILTAKHLAQASCTELTLTIQIIIHALDIKGCLLASDFDGECKAVLSRIRQWSKVHIL